MGWLFTSEIPRDITAWARERLDLETDTHRQTMLDVSLVAFTELYAAVELIDKRTGAREVTAATWMVRFVPTASSERFGYKDMHENSGPRMFACPKRILDRLTPTENEYAQAWRAANYARLEKRSTARAIQPGAVLKFDHPFYYSSAAGDRASGDLWEYAGTWKYGRRSTRNIFYPLNSDGERIGGAVRLRSWRDRDFEKLADSRDAYLKSQAAPAPAATGRQGALPLFQAKENAAA